MTFAPTPEQVTARDAFTTGGSLVIEALAGTGKTTCGHGALSHEHGAWACGRLDCSCLSYTIGVPTMPEPTTTYAVVGAPRFDDPKGYAVAQRRTPADAFYVLAADCGSKRTATRIAAALTLADRYDRGEIVEVCEVHSEVNVRDVERLTKMVGDCLSSLVGPRSVGILVDRLIDAGVTFRDTDQDGPPIPVWCVVERYEHWSNIVLVNGAHRFVISRFDAETGPWRDSEVRKITDALSLIVPITVSEEVKG